MPRDNITIRRRPAYFQPSGCPAASAFLNRTSGLDAAHISAYTSLICGLAADGLLNSDGTSNFFDDLSITATQNSATALLNLVSTSFTGILNGSPTFTADRGFTGVDGSTTVFIDTGFNPTTAGSPKFTQNSAHVSVWSVTNVLAGVGNGVAIGLVNNAFTAGTDLRPRYNDGNFYARINDAALGGGIANASSIGHFLANRSGASTQQGYKNAVDQGFTSGSSAAPSNDNFFVLAADVVTTGAFAGSALQIAAFSIGASLTPVQVTNFYNRLRTYMTAVGVP